MKHLSSQTLGIAVATSIAFALLACEQSSQLVDQDTDGTASVTLSVALTAPPSAPPASSAGGPALVPLANGLDLTEVRLFLEELELEGEVGRVEFETGPLAVTLDLSMTPQAVAENVAVPAGIYDELDVDIDIPDSPSLGPDFDPFLIPPPASVLISGTFDPDPSDGVPPETFELRLRVAEEVEVDIVPALEVVADVPTNITLAADITTWFIGEDGGLLDPRDPANAKQIADNIRDSFKAFEDQEEEAEQLLSFADLVEIVNAKDAGVPTRVEIEVSNGTLVAREIEIEEGDDIQDDEEIESKITAINVDPSTGTGTITLALGDLVIDLSDNATQFKDERGPGADEVISLAEFVARVEEARMAGVDPAVEVERLAQIPAQDPLDATFFAREIQLQDGSERPKIEINIDTDNLAAAAMQPPDGSVLVFGLMIDVDATNQVTEIEF